MFPSLEAFRLLFPYSSGFEFLWFDFLGLIFVACFFDHRRALCLRNLDVLMITIWVPLGDYEKGPLRLTTILGYAPLFYFLPRLCLEVYRKRCDPVHVAFPPGLLRRVTVALFAYAAFLIFVSPFPYQLKGDAPFISGSAAGGLAGARAILDHGIVYGNTNRLHKDDIDWGWDTYGPGYYYMFVPFEALFPTPGHFKYSYGFPARLLTLLLHLLAILTLRHLGRKLGDEALAEALGFAWAILPYTLITAYWSKTGDILPGALTVAALALYHASPFWGAIGLGYLSAATIFGVFYIPIWAAALPRERIVRFTGVVLATGAVLTVPQWMQPDGLGIFYRATVVWQENYGDWPYSLWTQYPETKYMRAYFKMTFLPFVAFATWMARGTGFRGAVALSGAVAIWIQLFKLYVPGRYHLWYLPFLLLALLPGGGREAEAAQDDPALAPASSSTTRSE